MTERRADGKTGILVSDDGNALLEARFAPMENLEALSNALDRMPGMVGHSLFYQIATKALIAKADGIEIVER